MEEIIFPVSPGSKWADFILQNIPVGVLTVDASMRVTYFNPQAERITGHLAVEAVGSSCGRLLRGGECDRNCPLRTVLSLERHALNKRTSITHKDGRVIPVNLRIAAMFGQNGELVGAVEAFADISRLVGLEEERARTLSMFAHDMKSPLTSAAGFLKRLEQGKAGELSQKQHKYLSIALADLTRVYSLALDFLDTARLEHGAGELRLSPVDLDQILSELAREFAERHVDESLQFDYRAQRPLPVVMADSARITRTINNLLDNARKYAGGGHIELKAGVIDHDSVWVEVLDQGPGLSKQDLAGLFKPFHRGSASLGTEGTGLGLAAAKAVAEAHGGSIRAENRPSGGARFVLSLPLPEEPDAEP